MPDDGRRTPEERVDAAIDLAVREMLNVEPRADLRARVIEQIDHPRRSFAWTWVMASIAAAAVLVIAVMVRQLYERPVSRPGTDVVLHAPDTGQPAVTARREEPRPHMGIPPVGPHQGRITAAVVTADDTNFNTAPPAEFAVIDALAAPPPIVLEQIPAATAPAVARLDIAPLELPALEVNALPDSPRERHD